MICPECGTKMDGPRYTEECFFKAGIIKPICIVYKMFSCPNCMQLIIEPYINQSRGEYHELDNRNYIMVDNNSRNLDLYL